MFHSEFYPTPRPVIEAMLGGTQIAGQTFLEPSAGKGDIIDYLKEQGAENILACEINADLRKIVESKARVIASDFFEVRGEHVSHINCIVMNPPFSNAEKHILHAWEIAPEGCEIIALCNSETVENRHYRAREEFYSIVKDYGSVEELGDCFVDAERKTSVGVSVMRLNKPVLSEDFDYDGFFLEDEPENETAGIIRYDEIREIVSRYIASVRAFDEMKRAGDALLAVVSPIGINASCSVSIAYKDKIWEKTDFIKDLQKRCWEVVFRKMKIEKYMTSGLTKDINKFVETKSKYPFTMRNIYQMIDLIVLNRETLLSRSLVEAVDNFTKHTHENRHHVEGWKTNEGHLLGRKFIVPYGVEWCEWGGGHLRIIYNSSRYIDNLSDLTKVLCFITGRDYDEINSYNETRNIDETCLTNILRGDKCQPNTWYNSAFFRFKGFKKGTLHIEFKDEDVWASLNRAYAKAKGQVLPETIKVKTKSKTKNHGY